MIRFRPMRSLAYSSGSRPYPKALTRPAVWNYLQDCDQTESKSHAIHSPLIA